MKLGILAGCVAVGFALAAPAQNVVITNARIIDGTGKVIEHGSVVAKDGKIVAVTAGGPAAGRSESFTDELRALNLVFSARDILKILGPNTAAAIGKSSELGTLEPGKRADLVIVDGNPLDDVFNLSRVVPVVKDGKVVSDQRGKRRAST